MPTKGADFKIEVMKITLKCHNEFTEYRTVKEAETFLNEMLYYVDKVELLASFTESVNYDRDTKLSHLQRDAVKYGEGWVNVYPIVE